VDIICSILLALDDTPGATAARDVAFALARRSGAALTAVIILDRPNTLGAHEAVPMGGAAFAARRNKKLAGAAAVLAACVAAAQGFSFSVIRREESPEEALLAEGATHDLIIIGRDSTLGHEACDDGLSPTIEALLRNGARPLLVVRSGVANPMGLAPGDDLKRPILIAHDGSMASMRKLHVFALMGLAQDQPVKLLDFTPDTKPEALARYLSQHGMRVEAFAVEGDRHDILLAEARSLPASLPVLGADQESGFAV